MRWRCFVVFKGKGGKIKVDQHNLDNLEALPEILEDYDWSRLEEVKLRYRGVPLTLKHPPANLAE